MKEENNSLISVIIPNFNYGIYLEECILSVLEQSIPIDIIVLDGNSTDNSLAIIHKYQRYFYYWQSCDDLGQAHAINFGVSISRTPYICWLNSDDFFLTDSLKYLLKEIESNTNYSFVYGNCFNYNNNKYSKAWVQKFSKFNLSMRCFISQPSTLIRRESWDKVGGLNVNLKLAFDYDLWWKLYLLCNFKPGFVEFCISVNRIHKKTKTINFRKDHYKEAMSISKKYSGFLHPKWILYYFYAVFMRSFLKI